MSTSPWSNLAPTTSVQLSQLPLQRKLSGWLCLYHSFTIFDPLVINLNGWVSSERVYLELILGLRLKGLVAQCQIAIKDILLCYSTLRRVA